MKNLCQKIKKSGFKIIEVDEVYYGLLLCGILIFFLRIINLECDLPPFGIAYYQAIDEGLYSKMAINLYKYGSMTNTGDFFLTIAPNYQVNIIANIIQYISMLIFGNNYYGFRIGYFLVAYITFRLQIIICQEIAKKFDWDNATSRWIILGICFFILTDFSYLLMSRTVENSCFRACSLAIAIYIFIKTSPRFKYFFLSLLGVVSMFLVYYSNVIILFGVGVLFINAVLRKEWKNVKKIMFQTFCGAGIGVIIAEIYYVCVWNQEAFSTLLRAVTSFSSRVNLTKSQNFLEKIIAGFYAFFGSNMFFYSISFLVITVLALIINSRYAIKKNDEFYIFINSCVFGGILQSMLTSDWMERKSISFYPVLIVNIFLLCYCFYKYKKSKLSEKKICKYKIEAFAIWIFLALIIYKMFEMHENNSYFKDFTQMDVVVLIVGTLTQFLIISLLLTRRFLLSSTTIKKCCCILLLSSIVSVNMFFSFKYVYNNDNYISKNTMRDIGYIVGDDYIAGPYAYGFCLYNECKAISSEITVTAEMIDCGVNYVLDYSNGPTYADQIIPPNVRELVYEQIHSVQVEGSYNLIGLYKKTI